MSQRSEPSAIEYARFYGLTQDHLEIPPLQGLHGPADFLQQLEEPLGTFSIDQSEVEIPSERIFIDAGTASLPPESATPPPWKGKSVAFNDVLTEIAPQLPEPIPGLDGDVILEDIDAFFDEMIKPIATKAERRAEQEQLDEADTTRRVAVPIMDFSLPIAPWKIVLREMNVMGAKTTYTKILKDMKLRHFKNHLWPLSGKTERELQWTPFPATLGKVDLNESIPDDGTTAKYVTLPEGVDTDSLAWKPEGLRLFDKIENADEEELEVGSFPEGKDFESLLRKRKLNLEWENEEASPVSQIRRMNPTGPPENLQGKAFSATESLEDFISIRTGIARVPRTRSQTFVAQPALQKSKVSRERQDQPGDSSRNHLVQSATVTPTPIVSVPKEARLFVVSAAFLKDRKLARQILKAFPTAELVERNFSLHASSPALASRSKPGYPPSPRETLADEADIILSPSTGLIWTTLQKIKQRSLPGQIARSAVRERITHTAPRYERLMVLISEDRQPSTDEQDLTTSKLHQSDSEALAQITAFCSGLQDETHVTFVTGGTDELASWIVAMMAKYSISSQDIGLMQDETSWELSLRKAGINAFAAQVVLTKLSARSETAMNGRTARDFGFTAFVQMSDERRIASFEGLLGGRKLLDRFNRVVEAHRAQNYL